MENFRIKEKLYINLYVVNDARQSITDKYKRCTEKNKVK